jgi:hypothetical protein
MKTIYQSIFLFVILFSLSQCEESTETSAPGSADAGTTALGNNELVMYAHASPDKFLVYIFGPAGTTVNVDWGDGSSEQVAIGEGGGEDLEKYYDAPGRYEVIVTGDIRQLTGLQSGYGEGVFDSINLSGLRNLQSIRMGLTPGPAVFDLSANKNLREVWFTNVNELTQVILPKKHSISTVSIAGPNLMGTAAVDAVIVNIYNNAVKQQIFNGSFNAMEKFYLYEGDEGYNNLVGPPSESSVAMLRILQDDYGWEIVPRLE